MHYLCRIIAQSVYKPAKPAKPAKGIYFKIMLLSYKVKKLNNF